MKSTIRVLVSSVILLLISGCGLWKIMGEGDEGLSHRKMLKLYPDYKDCRIWDWDRNMCVIKQKDYTDNKIRTEITKCSNTKFADRYRADNSLRMSCYRDVVQNAGLL